MFRVMLAVAAVLALLVPSTVLAQAFTLNDLAILRVGDGTNPLVNTGGPISLQDITRTGTVTITVNITSTGVNGLQVSGTATSEGLLSISSDLKSLVFTGYNPGAGGFTGTGSLASRTSAQAPRAYGSVDLTTGNYTFGAAFTGANTDFSGNNIRAAVTTPSGTYATGANSGVLLNPSTAISTTSVNNRVINAQNGNLYFTTASTIAGVTSPGIWQIAGFPTSGPVTATPLITTSTLTSGTLPNSPYGFAISPGPITNGTVAYIADSAATGVSKYTFNGSTWTLNYNFTATGNGLTDLVVDFSGAQPQLFAVSPTDLFSVTDTGSGGAMNSIASAGTNFAFRGIELVSAVAVPEPTTYALLGMTGLVGSGAWFYRRRRLAQVRFGRRS